MRITVFIFVFAFLGLSGAMAMKGDPAKGKAKAAICAACHGTDGISSNDLWPNLKGQKFGYLVKQMKAFKSGERKEPLMDAMMKPLTEEDINNLAAYFSSMK